MPCIYGCRMLKETSTTGACFSSHYAGRNVLIIMGTLWKSTKTLPILVQVMYYKHIHIHTHNVNILGGCAHTIKKNTEALVVASKETGLEVNADRTKYMVMSRDQNAGQNQNINIDNSSFERVEEFKYLGSTLTNQNSIQEEIKIRLKSGNDYHNSLQNLLFSISVYKNIKIKIYRNRILPVFCMGMKHGC